ncbi:hypothetical protein GCM10009565_61900 [Amycolatopsis albidoflavus]
MSRHLSRLDKHPRTVSTLGLRGAPRNPHGKVAARRRAETHPTVVNGGNPTFNAKESNSRRTAPGNGTPNARHCSKY